VQVAPDLFRVRRIATGVTVHLLEEASMRASITVVCLAASILALDGCQARPAEFTTEDESTVRAMFDSTVANIRAGDWTTWSQQFTDNAVLQPPNAKPVSGRAAILAWGKAFPPVAEISFSNVQVAGDGNMAYGTSVYLLKLKGAPADSGKQLVVFRRSAGGPWQIPAVSFSSDLAVPAPSPGTAQRSGR
jgi:ketosteroid isomerase-like protein